MVLALRQAGQTRRACRKHCNIKYLWGFPLDRHLSSRLVPYKVAFIRQRMYEMVDMYIQNVQGIVYDSVSKILLPEARAAHHVHGNAWGIPLAQGHNCAESSLSECWNLVYTQPHMQLRYYFVHSRSWGDRHKESTSDNLAKRMLESVFTSLIHAVGRVCVPFAQKSG